MRSEELVIGSALKGRGSHALLVSLLVSSSLRVVRLLWANDKEGCDMYIHSDWVLM